MKHMVTALNTGHHDHVQGFVYQVVTDSFFASVSVCMPYCEAVSEVRRGRLVKLRWGRVASEAPFVCVHLRIRDHAFRGSSGECGCEASSTQAAVDCANLYTHARDAV